METKNRRNIPQFNGERYSIWKFRVRALLMEENAVKVLDNDPPEIPDEQWQKLERMAKSVIVEYLSDTMIGFASDNATAREIFANLDAIYERKSLATQLSVQKKLLSLKFNEDMPLIKHFLRFDELIIELLAAGGTQTEMAKIAHLLLTLPQSYDGIVTAIHTLTDETLSLAFVKTKLLDYETKLKSNISESSSKVLQVKTHHQEKPREKPNPIRRRWGNRNFKSMPKGPVSSTLYQANLKFCKHCGRKNHIKRNCWFYKKMLQKQENFDRNRTLQIVQAEPESSAGVAFMVGAHQAKSQKSSSELNFILDSGATDHLVNQSNLFTTVTRLEKPLKISVAKTGVSIRATLRGTINIITNLGIKGVLENVLYAEEVPYNLLSVRRLQDAGMTVIFNKDGGVSIKKGKQLLLTGKSYKNLINIKFDVLKSDVHHVNVASTSSPDQYTLWHERFGHVSKQKLLEIQKLETAQGNSALKNINNTSNALCEACIYGKQARLPFAKAKDKTHLNPLAPSGSIWIQQTGGGIFGWGVNAASLRANLL